MSYIRTAHVCSILTVGAVVWASGCDTFYRDCVDVEDPDSRRICNTFDTGTPARCVPSENAKSVDDTCGVFVSSRNGDDATGKGTKAAPYKTLATAISKRGNKPVYACGEPFTEAVTLSAGVTLFGALECTQGWKYDASTKTTLTADPDAIPLTVTSTASGAQAHDFAITAADAMKDGGSSIALVVDQGDLTLEKVDIIAGVAKAGVVGAAQAKVMTPATAKGSDGTDDAICNVPGSIGGGLGGKNTCDGIDSNGGIGGQGIAATNGGNGGDGLPIGASNGGVGETKMTQCQPGQQGTQGKVGMPGTGARGIGDLSGGGYKGPDATPGMAGTPGQGGGGGGGARQCDVNGMYAGPSGGGGGAGGCGGAVGNPGQSGGSSMGIVALSAKLTLKTVTITTKDGGAGGVGGDGQLGGAGGQQGNQGGANACPGGIGGAGGRGGSGGGGTGGHAVGIAIKGGMLPDLGSTMINRGKGAPGGIGGDMDMTPQTKGDDGLGCKTLDFTNPMSPMACVM